MDQPLPAALHLNASATSCRIDEGLPGGKSVARALNEILVPEMPRLINDREYLPRLGARPRMSGTGQNAA
jgi:hypothetical protein